jgi:hypothetical protein
MDSSEDYYLLQPDPLDAVTAVDDQDFSVHRREAARTKISA